MAKDNRKTVERVVRATFFRYTKLVPIPGDDNDKVRPVVVSARRDERINVLVAEAERADALGAFYPDAAVTVDKDTGETVVEVDIRDMSDDALAQYIKEDKPTVSELVDLSEDDAGLAERILNAERVATGGKVRSTLNKSLTEVMDKAAGQGDVPVETEGTP